MPPFYTAVPPTLFPVIARSLDAAGLNSELGRLVVEKPYGDSLESAKTLTNALYEGFTEGRSSGSTTTWARRPSRTWWCSGSRTRSGNASGTATRRLVQLTVASRIGVEGRAGYYEYAGATRDLLQNHLLQVVATVAMEAPSGGDPQTLKDAQLAVFRAIDTADPAHYVRGQYDGYRQEEGVDPKSQIETFVAARMWIDNWRWDGVPFYLRHGKKLPIRNTEITVVFRQAPDYLFRDLELEHIPSNHLTIRVQPDEDLAHRSRQDSGPGYHLQTVRMDFDSDESFTDASAEAYERLCTTPWTATTPCSTGPTRSTERGSRDADAEEPPPLFHPGVLGSLARGPPDRTARMAPAHARRRHDGPPLMTFIDISLPIGPTCSRGPATSRSPSRRSNGSPTATPQRERTADRHTPAPMWTRRCTSSRAAPGSTSGAPDVLVGECVVVDARSQGELTVEDMEALAIPDSAERVLHPHRQLRPVAPAARSSSRRSTSAWPDAARWVVARDG